MSKFSFGDIATTSQSFAVFWGAQRGCKQLLDGQRQEAE
jgi:hypothetical protein